MAKVTCPFYSTFATGTLNNTLTVYPRYNNNKFVMQIHKRYAGKRHQIQIDNAKIFKNKMRAFTLLRKNHL